MTVASASKVGSPASSLRPIERKLHRARRRHLLARSLCGAAEVVLWALALAALSLGADYLFDLQSAGRLLVLMVYGALLVVAVVRWLVVPVLGAPEDDELALRVEAHHPELASALISAVQLGRRDPDRLGEMSWGLIRALCASVAQRTRPMSFASVIPVRSALRLAAAALLAVLSVWGFARGHDALVSAWADRFFRPLASTARYPTRTQVTVITGDVIVPRGEDVEIEALARGQVPSLGVLHYRARNGRWQTADLLPVEETPSRFSLTLERLLETTEYYVELGDARSETFDLRVIVRPRVTQLVARYQLPAYAGGGTRESPTGDVDVLVGTWVEVTAATNKPVTEAHLELDGSSIPVEVAGDGRLRTRFQVMADGTYRIHLLDRHRLANQDPVVHLVRALQDRPPRVVVRSPGRNKDMTPVASLPIQFELTDDFGITEVELRYAVQKPLMTGLVPGVAEQVGGEVGAAQVPLALGPPELTYARLPLSGSWRGRSVQGQYTLELEPLSLEEGDTLYYYLRAADNRDVDLDADDRNWADSREYEVRVVSSRTKREEIRLRQEEAFREIQLIIDKQKGTKQAVEDIVLEPAPDAGR